jgi:hypothetical protein
MRLCEIVMSDSPIAKGITWQQADFSWMWAWVPVWSQIEVDVAIVAASLPSLSPLFKQAWLGFHTPTRASTPSQIPTLPGYRESWGVGKRLGSFDDDVEKGTWDSDIEKLGRYDMGTFDKEKRLTVREKEMDSSLNMEMSYYDDSSSDVEEDEMKGRPSIGFARTADVQIVVRIGAPRVVEYTKL